MTTRARPLTNAERQRRYRARCAFEHRRAQFEGRTLLHDYCRILVDNPYRDMSLAQGWPAGTFDRGVWLVDNGMTMRRCRFVEEYTLPRLPIRDARNAAFAYRLAGYAPRWSAVLGPKLCRVPCVAQAISWVTERIRDRLVGRPLRS